MFQAEQTSEAEISWYCVRAKTKKERYAAEGIAARYGLEVFCPMTRFRRKTARGAVWFQEALFPGYFFVRFNLFTMQRAVSHAHGVLGLPVFGGQIVSIPDAVVVALREDVDEEGVVETDLPLMPGDETTILEGSMRGLKVKVIRVMPAQQRVGVLMELLGTFVEAEFASHALESGSRSAMSCSDG